MTPEQQVQAVFETMANVLAENMRLELSYLGQECVNNARDRGEADSWKDRTGNLRSSIGFAFYQEGEKIVESAFNQVGADPTGSKKGKSFVEDLARELSSTYALVIVAGMDYAEYVETKRDVLASTELYARTKINETVQRAINSTIAKINNMFR